MTDKAQTQDPERAERRRRLMTIIGVVAAVAVVAAILMSWSDPVDPSVTFNDPDKDAPDLAGAIGKAREMIGNSADETTARSLVLLGWSNRHLKWPMVEVKTDETSHDLVEKSVDAQVGKRMCVKGKVSVLHLVKTDAARSGAGVMVTDEGKQFSFMAARNAGSVPEQTVARLCGVVTGWNGANSDLGPARAAVIVGLFEADKDSPIDI